ncbi:gliding motility-associated protein GldE, partial [Cyclobacteriaceae bacterium]|nr:gliding motility-associated protein GldE [Cyclobacteriaceae bacterium]
TAFMLAFFNQLFFPFAFLLLKMSSVIEKRIAQKGYDVSVDDLHEALEMTTEESTEEEKDILKGVVKFGTIHVKQIMRSRMDVTAIDIDTDFHQLMDKINKCGFSRIPVYKESIDHIAGILYIKDILPFIDNKETYNWQQLLREPYFIPENKKIDDLLRNFQSKRVHMAIVVDEYAGTSGLITLEDVIEEIVGDINDEFDHEAIDFKKVDSSTYVFEGKTSLNDLTKIINAEDDIFDEVKGESESLAGLILELNAEMPHAGDRITHDNFTFVIESVSNKRIKRVKININENIQTV